MKPRYRITLTDEERKALQTMTRTGKSNAHRFVHAQALLLCDLEAHSAGRWNVVEVADALGISERTIERPKHRFVENGLEAAPKANAAFVANMEDVLDLYHTAYDPLFPLVCMDESNKQMAGQVQCSPNATGKALKCAW
jgi:hypothetical protein